MEATLRMMIDKREIIAFSEAGGALSLEREKTLELWNTRLDAVVRGMMLNAETIPAFHAMIELLKEDKAAEAGGLFAEARAARTADDIIPRVNALRDLLLTKEGEPRKRSYRLKGEEFDVLELPAMVLRGAFRRAARFLEASGDPALHGDLYDDTRLLLGIYHDALRRYSARKERQNALDFEDLQLRLLDALRTEESRAVIARRFPHIMIDEFQDTNELQYRIASDLLDNLAFGHLCIVGDRKQSIYGFRNAEVEVFTRATGDIKLTNRELGRDEAPLFFQVERIEPESREEMLGEIKLSASFRLLPSLCAYVNESCGPLFRATSVSTFGVDYEPLVCARRTSGRGSVEFILQSPEPEETGERRITIASAIETPDDDPDRCDPIWCPEAEMIARRIVEIVARAEPVVWECPAGADEEIARPARFSDIAILCRKRSHFPAIEAALRKYGVPFVTHGGSGFYKTQEIYDLLNYLRVLLNSRDEISLLGVLRSPFFCVSDAELFRLTLDRGGEDGGRDLWSRAVRRVASGSAEEPLRRAVEMIGDDHAMAGRIPISLLIRRVLERTGWRGAVVGAERGEQNLANIDKLLEMAREYETRGFTNLFDFVERISEMVELEEMEGEAPINTGRDAVRLMTMHASKGLEFPVVILPSLHSPARVSTEPFFDKELGFGWNWRFNGEEHRPAIVALMGLRESERERAEEARLFYVAITRARDMLILCGEYDHEKPPVGTMLEWALAPFREVPERNIALRLFSPGLRFLEPDGATERVEPWEQRAGFRLVIEELPKYDPAAGDSRPFPAGLVRIGELPARAEGEIYSATQFLVYHQCPTKYYLKYRLGIPEEIGEAYDILPDTRDSDDGTIFARLFRRTAQRIDEAFAAPPDPDGKSALERVVDAALLLEPLVTEDLDRMKGMLMESYARLFASESARTLLFPAGGRPRVDYELRMPFGEEYLLGVIDRVIEHEDGTLSIVQYKTRRLERAEVQAAATGYLPQLRVYAYLVSKLNPAQRAINGTVLFTEHPDAPQSFTFTKFESMRIEEELRSAIADIRAITYSGRRDLPLRTPHCPECPYFIEGSCLLGRGS
jgi:ATP-dependent helicase/nuclease subunit A